MFLVVGVPGSGKDTVLKRYLRSLGLPLIDASADLVKEYLAAWADDELSNEVRRNNEARGPGKHLLHAQYLHRESIHIVDTAVTEARRRGESLLLEKTLFNVEPVLAYARAFRQCESPARRGRRVNVHLLGTVVSPRQNWAFLRERMTSGRSFGRYIRKDQTLAGLRRYHANMQAILGTRALRSAFDSIHVYDVDRARWAVSVDSATMDQLDQQGLQLGSSGDAGLI